MTKRILCSTDLSTEGNRCVPHATSWAEAFGAELHLMTVRDTLAGAGVSEETFGAYRQFEELAEKRARAGLDALEVPAGLTVERHISADPSPTAGIIELAEGLVADLLVIGRKGGGELARVLLGSTAEQVVRLSPVSTLVVPVKREASRGFERIVITDDLSDAARVGLEWGLRVAAKMGGEVLVVHVADTTSHLPVILSGAESVFDEYPELKAQLRARIGERVRAAGGEECDFELIISEGRPAGKIATIAREHDATCIVTSPTGLGSGERRLFGSVVGKLLRIAPCPVLVART